MTQKHRRAIQKLERAVGRESPPMTHDVERGAVIKFARAIGDPNPLFCDETQARRTRYGGVIAPPTFLRYLPAAPLDPPIESPFARRLDGGSQWEYYIPVRPGDRITVTQKLADVSQRDGRLGPMLFMTREIRYVNQLDETVAIQRNVGISY